MLRNSDFGLFSNAASCGGCGGCKISGSSLVKI